MFTSLQTIVLLAAVLTLAVFFIHNTLLPKPLPGIPYHQKSARRILGDVPDVLKHNAETAEVLSFLEKRCRELGSPIFQVFMKPFSKPWVIVADGREAAAIMSRTSQEFDRSPFIKGLLDANFPHTMVCMPTNDRWKANRRLVAETMSSSFLNEIGAQAVHENICDLINMWRQKARLANGHPFNAKKDTEMSTMDTIWAAAFGEGLGTCKSQTDFFAGLKTIPLPESKDALVEMPSGELPEAFHAIVAINSSSEISMRSPLGSRHHWFALHFYPSLRRAMAFRERYVSEKIQQAWETFGKDEKESTRVKCAVEFVVRQEVKAARKQSREPNMESKYLAAEMNSFIGAGYETSASAVTWGLKYLTHYQDVQRKLQEELRIAMGKVDGQPAAKALAKSNLPYMDAFIDEVLRYSAIVSSNARIATADTFVLGHRIPKGTELMMITNGPSILRTAISIEESKRSEASKADDKAKWSHIDLDKFRPERFLNAQGQYDPNAAPMQSFGFGTRACFGKKLAYLEMRIMYALILWNFDLQPISDKIVDWKAIDIVAHQAQNCMVSLRERSV